MLITLPKRASVRDRETEFAQRRLNVLKLAKQLGNVTEACRRSGMDRTRFYDWKRRFAAYGLDGLKDLPPVHKTHPMTTSADATVPAGGGRGDAPGRAPAADGDVRRSGRLDRARGAVHGWRR